MSGKWLGKAAVLWAFDEARTKDGADVPAALVSTLLAVARFASEDGTGAYPSARDVATLTRKSMRQAQRDIDGLEKLGLIVRGDQRKAIHIAFHHRPIVYDLPIGPYDTHDVGPTTPRVRRYDTGDAGIRHPRRTKRSRKDREQRDGSRSGAGAPHSAAQPGRQLQPQRGDTGDLSPLRAAELVGSDGRRMWCMGGMPGGNCDQDTRLRRDGTRCPWCHPDADPANYISLVTAVSDSTGRCPECTVADEGDRHIGCCTGDDRQQGCKCICQTEKSQECFDGDAEGHELCNRIAFISVCTCCRSPCACACHPERDRWWKEHQASCEACAE